MTIAMILCAGLGTRLRPITDELPKPLVWVGDRPLLAHIAERLARGGVRRAVLNTHHLADRFDARILGALPLDASIVHEPKILGTAGGVAGAAAALGPGDVLVWNGDILAEVDVAALGAAHVKAAGAGALATLAVAWRHPTEARVGEGTAGIGADGSVVRLRGERFGEEVRGADFVGVQIVGERARARLPAEGCLVGDVYLPAMREGARVASFAIDGGFSDLGTATTYLEENLRWIAAHGSFVGRDVHVEPAVSVATSVLGDGVTVRGRGEVRDVVAWPGATFEAPLARAIVLGSGTIVRV
ncbi:sugar phosphate nucleotidyltransferase [Polyangium sp. y55x31]|uniref:nucleotidyltransferase family protein n=1 Tax=Polyangium sp. y55x31 TaxID=3042688 RepID=UPI002482E015|nr:sugar phosphate nucleotidyltransferase [Polyangium sp. y55x31]MDI1478788.1 sugar phosphate nucleotidyltransferase [Polyangium sp. y55x31]